VTEAALENPAGSVARVEDPRAERAVTLAVMVVAAVIAVVLVNTGPDHGGPAASVAAVRLATGPETGTAPPASSVPAAAAPAPASTAPPGPTTTVATSDPGSLPQTTDKPEASGATFDAGVQGLWTAIVRDDPSLAMPFFFPKQAYLQVKAIPDPATDYQQRLIATLGQDIHTLHAQLGADASSAHFDGIDVPGDQAVLVQPGEESNKLPYWRVYGTTLRYSLNGTGGTLPVTSLISWRGEWYLVHLGAIR
jgi:hypothetical protein